MIHGRWSTVHVARTPSYKEVIGEDSSDDDDDGNDGGGNSTSDDVDESEVVF